MSVELYPHNQATYIRMIEMFESSNRVAIVQPTGTGKSFLFLRWIEDHPGNRIVILSPSAEIFAQLQEYSHTSELEISDNVQMITYQALLFASEQQIQAIKVDKIILDEFHRIGAELWGPAVQALLDNNPSAKILGATATPIRYLDEGKNMAKLLFDNNLAQNMTLGEAVREGILPMPKYYPAWYDVDEKLTAYQNDIRNVKSKATRKNLEEQLERLRRTLENSYGAETIFKEYMPDDHGKYIVFCRSAEHLTEMLRVVPEWLEKVNPEVRCYVSISAELDKDKQLHAFKLDNGSDAIKLLFTIDRLNEGVHVNGIDGVIMLRPTISPIIYLQQMGRALAAANKSPLIFDFVNNYQSVRISMGDGTYQNVFEREFSGGLGADTDHQTFRIFSKAIEFASLFGDLEHSLYPSNDQLWYAVFEKYKRFKNKYGRDPKFREIFENFNLGYWCRTQRSLYVKGILSDDRTQALLSAGFNFDPSNSTWAAAFHLYLQYKNKYHCDPKHGDVYNNFNLGKWTERQRFLYRKGTLSKKRVHLLFDAGFVFDPQDNSWNKYFNLYQKYKGMFFREPKYNEIFEGCNLGSWACVQRAAYRKGRLSEERIQMLLGIGFPLVAFDYTVCVYQKFKNVFCREPNQDEFFEGIYLGRWVARQRTAYKNGFLSERCVQLLLDAGFVFDPHEQYWNKCFALYIEYKQTHKFEPKSREIFKGVNIGNWITCQKSAYKKGKLSKERVRKLKDADFPFPTEK